MSLQNFSFFAFLFVSGAIYLHLPQKLQTPFLLLTSLFFYIQNLPAASAENGCLYRWFPLLLCCVLLVFIRQLSIAIEGAKSEGKGRLVRFGIITLLVVLAVFKYYNLSFMPTLFERGFFHRLPFPLGISFFTFAAIGYLVDVGRGDVKAERDLASLGVFLFFFATITSGPICRAGKLLPQLHKEHRFDEARTVNALRLYALGLFKKVAVADVLALYVNQVFGNISNHGGLSLIFALILYTFQLYFDFCGYSDSARACGLLLGIDLPENFKTPFFATNFSGFWNRWHISLSSWLQDYLFMPLVWADSSRLPLLGKKYDHLPATFCVFCVFFTSGFWHGSTLPFVVWGLMQAIYRVGEELCHRRFGKPKKKQPQSKLWPKRIGVFVLWAFSMIFFRIGSGPNAGSVADGFAYLGGMFRRLSPARFLNEFITDLYAGFYANSLMAAAWCAFVIFGFAVCLYLDWQRFFHFKDKPTELVLGSQKAALRWLLYYGLIIGILAGLIIQNGGFGGGASFAYANF